MINTAKSIIKLSGKPFMFLGLYLTTLGVLVSDYFGDKEAIDKIIAEFQELKNKLQ
jgi:hypothetical protein